jgi:predicted transcriptional regulator
MVNRDRHDITFEILRKATAGKKKTELMREVGLSSTQAKNYLSILVEKGLLEMNEKRLFKTTSKGLEFLEKCEQCPLFKWDRQKSKLMLK